MLNLRIRHAFVAVLLALGLLCQETWALAGTTGGLSGNVYETGGTIPVANAKITASSPSQTLSTQTDASGRFVFISLAPDTYVVSAEKEGYTPSSQPGVTVFADSTQTVGLTLQKALKNIASVTSRSAGALVKPGTTADVYSVNASTLAKLGALGGGGALNSAYSAVASIPGAYVPLGQSGYFQTVHIRGGDYDQVGYELDGVPVNRSFDNYPSGALSSLGNQELQVYTGATPANSEGQGLAGYVNQVIKSGTFPGFADISLGVGAPTFYHKLALEVGGASPNRNFSYYLGIGGYNQDFRFVDNQNGAGYGQFGTALTQLTPPAGASCADPLTPYSSCYANGAAGPGGYTVAPYQWGQLANISDRDVIANVHFALPHKGDGGKDDIQLLFDSGSLLNGYYSSLNDAGGLSQFPANSNNPGPPVYLDGLQWSGPVGTALPANYQSLVSNYLFPSGPSQRSTFANIPADGRDTTWNDQEIVKLQYQKNLGTNAYFRIYGYTYYSDWLQYGPESTFANYASPTSPDYELSSHTRGVSAAFADQINAKNLINLQASYTTANSVRDNNTQMLNGFGPGKRSNFAVAVDPNNPVNGICYNVPGAAGGTGSGIATPTTCDNQEGSPAATWATWANAAAGTIPTINGATCGTGPCQFLVAENSLYAVYNSVRPVFTALSATDEFRPSDKLLLNLGVRLDRFQFTGSNTVTDAARQFWFTAFNLDNCIFTATGAPVDKVNGLGLTPTSACPSGYTAANLQNTPSQVNSYNVFQPRIGGTYTFNPDSVLRFSYGKYVEPPDTAYEQYDTLQENLPALLGGSFYKFGFNTPGHEVRPPISYNTDISFEHHFKGTDWSFTFTPFLRKTRDQIQNFFLDQATGFVSGLNVGKQTSRGFEFQLNKGDFDRNGLSGQLSFAYTNSYINYGTLANGTTVVSQINNDIRNYNAYTKGCATGSASAALCGSTSTGATAAACFTPSGTPDPACGAGDIGNPYWNAPVQGTLDPGANYPVYDIFPGGIGGSANSFTAPYVGTLILNYKHDKWAFTPTVQFQAGNRYGSPESTPGIDPAAGGCGTLAATAGDPRYPYGNPGPNAYNAVSCAGILNAIPNNFTGQFDQPGAFRNPSQILANLQVSYEASPKITITGTFANLISRCFGGQTEAWTLSDGNVCSYSILNNAGAFPPVGNVYNPGAPIQRLVQYPYAPYLGPTNVDSNSTASAGAKAPFNFYLDAKIKI